MLILIGLMVTMMIITLIAVVKYYLLKSDYIYEKNSNLFLETQLYHLSNRNRLALKQLTPNANATVRRMCRILDGSYTDAEVSKALGEPGVLLQTVVRGTHYDTTKTISARSS